MKDRILIVDDEEDIRDLVSDILSDEGYKCITAANSTQTFQQIQQNKPNIILLDIWLQGSDLDGLGILENIKEKYPFIPVIMISGHGTIETAVTAIKLGAYDYIEKPFSPSKLNIVVARALEASKLKRENLELKKKISTKPELIGSSPAILQLKSQIEKTAPSSSRVLIKGEYGAGKELVAKYLHKLSPKKLSPFVTINSAIINNPKIRQEFLGDPTEKKFGIAELVVNGSLYIENISELPNDIQKNILKFIQGNNLSQSASKYNIRIISSISMEPEEAIRSKKLIKDLFYRLNVVEINVPPLRERKEDIEELCMFYLGNLEKLEGFAPKTIAEEVIASFQSYNWPGNLKELKNLVEKLFIIANIRHKQVITMDMLNVSSDNSSLESKNSFSGSTELNPDFVSLPLRQAREAFEKQYLAAQMSRFNNNISKTSLFIGMERSALHRKLKMLNIHSTNNQKGSEE